MRINSVFSFVSIGLVSLASGALPALGADGLGRDAASLKRWEARRAGVRSAAAGALERIPPASAAEAVEAAPDRGQALLKSLAGGAKQAAEEATEASEKQRLSQVEAEGYFSYLAGQTQIPFRYPEDGCYARAHEMARLLEEKGVESEKIFLFGNLRVETRFAPEGVVTWWYHVAPVVQVQDEVGGAGRVVIDPSVSSSALQVSEWIAIQTGENCREIPLGTPYAEGCFYQFTARFTYLPSAIDLRPTQ